MKIIKLHNDKHRQEKNTFCTHHLQLAKNVPHKTEVELFYLKLIYHVKENYKISNLLFSLPNLTSPSLPTTHYH
jgi:hypothetical protein